MSDINSIPRPSLRALEQLATRFRAQTDRYPEIWSARVDRSDGSKDAEVIPELLCAGSGTSAGLAVSVKCGIASQRDLKELSFSVFDAGQWGDAGCRGYHVIYGNEVSQPGWEIFQQRVNELIEECERVDKAMLGGVKSWSSILQFFEFAYSVAERPRCQIPLVRNRWVRWRDRDGKIQDHHFGLSPTALERNFEYYGRLDDKLFEVKYTEFGTNIWRVAGDLIETLLMEASSAQPNVDPASENGPSSISMPSLDEGSSNGNVSREENESAHSPQSASVPDDPIDQQELTENETISFPGPDQMKWRGVVYQCELTKKQRQLLKIICRERYTEIDRIMCNSSSAPWQEKYGKEKIQRRKIAKFLSRLNKQLGESQPQFPLIFALKKGQGYVQRL